MRVRMLESRGVYEAGKSYDVPIELGAMWIRTRRAYLDKSIDGPPEVKVEPEVRTWPFAEKPESEAMKKISRRKKNG